MVRQEMIVFFMAHGIIYNYVAKIQKKMPSLKQFRHFFSIFRQDLKVFRQYLKSSDEIETISDEIETCQV